MLIENACRVLMSGYGDLQEGLVGALLPSEGDNPEMANVEFPIGGRLQIEEVPLCLLRQATLQEAKSFMDATWDIYDRTNWN